MTRRIVRRRRRGHSERGSTLVLALVVIMIVAVAGAAVLEQQSSAPRAQEAYVGVRKIELSADDGAAGLAKTMRFNQGAGIAGTTGLCGNTAMTRVPGSAGTYKGPDGKSYEVWCAADPTSGTRKGMAGDVPDSVMLALGGYTGLGNPRGAVGTKPVAPVQIAPGESTASTGKEPSYRNTFCDDWAQPGSSRCEAGIYVGRAVAAADDETGGLRIQSNGALNPNAKPLVVANGAIVVNTSQVPDRKLWVGGNVKSRRACGGWNTSSNAWTATSVESVFGPVAGLDCGPFPGPTTVPTSGPWVNNYGLPLEPDPMYVHAPIDPAQLQRVDNLQASPYNLPASLCTDGFVAMPARKIAKQGTTDVFGAWYDSAKDLAALMDACTDTTFWFRPGVYYFDFLDKDEATKWQAPRGCFPIQPSSTACGASQIVTGVPKGWSSNEATMMTSPQPIKLMTTNWNDATPAANWEDVPETMAIDGVPGGYDLYDGGGHLSGSLVQKELQTPLPQIAGHYKATNPITKLKFEISYSLPSTPSLYKAAQEDPLNPPRAGAQIEIRVPGTPGGSCYLTLNPGDHSALDPTVPNRVKLGTNPNAADAGDDPDQSIWLENGCPLSDSRFQKATGIFAPLLPAGSCTALIPAADRATSCGAFAGWDPHSVNILKASLWAGTFDSTDLPLKARVEVDGMQFVVEYTGRPSPTFPDGCDRTGPGTQFVFGGTARMDWGAGGREIFAELCASEQSKFPNWNNDPQCAPGTYVGDYRDPTKVDLNQPCNHIDPKGKDFNIAIYGVNETSGTRRDTDNDPNDSTWHTGDVLNTADVPFLPDPSPICPNPDTALGMCTDDVGSPNTTPAFETAKPSQYHKIDGDAAVATWTGIADHELVFNLPNIVCDFQPATNPWTCPEHTIPQGSTITNVKVKIRHREGEGVTSILPADLGRNIAGVTLSVKAGESVQGSNSFTSGTWNSATSNGVNVNEATGVNQPLPICTQGGLGYSATTGWCDYVYGDPRGPEFNTDSNARWTLQRDLTDALSSPEGIGGGSAQWQTTGDYGTDGSPGAQLIWQVKAPTGATNKHRAELDGVELIVSYRAAGSLRPLRGCHTTRTEFAPGFVLPSSNGPNTDDDPAGIIPDPAYRWLDTDWGTRPFNSSIPFDNDEPFATYNAGSGAGNSPASDVNGCALLSLDTAGAVVKFHAAGLLYAPSAALYLTGSDNDASWSTDGMIARTIAAFRWKKGGGIPALGGTPPPRNDRRVTVEIRDGSRVVLRQVLAFDDNEFAVTPGMRPLIGERLTVLSHVRNPS